MKAIIVVPETDECKGCIYDRMNASCTELGRALVYSGITSCNDEPIIYKLVELEDNKEESEK